MINYSRLIDSIDKKVSNLNSIEFTGHLVTMVETSSHTQDKGGIVVIRCILKMG